MTEEKLETIIARLCSLPREFHSRGDVSYVKLIQESGYADVAEYVDRSRIQRELQIHPELIDDWELHSTDQRCSPAWFFERSRNMIGFISAEGTSREQFFPSPAEACAEYILLNLNQLLKFAQRSKSK